MSNSTVTDPGLAGTDDGSGGASQSLMITVLTTNSLSVVGCVAVLTLYVALWRRYPRLLGRLSLRLAAAMAFADLLFHICNLSGYGNLPQNFVCSFIGGFLYAAPSMLSLFYASAIAFNSQLIFVFKRQPDSSRAKWFLILPLVLVLIICIPTLAAGWYGYDNDYGYCWYSSYNATRQTIQLRVMFTYNFWCFLPLVYMFIAFITIVRSVFSKHSRIAQLSHTVSQTASTPSPTLSRRDVARRALTIRLLGLCFTPAICVVPVIITDVLLKQGIPTPDWLVTFLSGIQGMAGFFNACLVVSDPAVLAIFHARKVETKKKRDLQRGIPLSFNSNGGPGTYDVTQSELDKRNGGRCGGGGGAMGGIMIKVEVQRVTDDDDDILGDMESDLSGL